MQEMTMDEVEQVSGAAIPIVAWKIGAWAVGAVFGAGLVVAVKHLLD